VRQALDIAFEGYTEPETFLLGDVRLAAGTLDRKAIHLWWKGSSLCALFPFGTDSWRIFARRGEGDSLAPPTLADLQAEVDAHGPPGLTLADPGWLSAFRVNERLAASYRAGRLFLLGDAAHVHSPAGGQGMNTGMQDAVNLAWKLALVLKGRGDPAVLLDSYEAERRPVAEDVVRAAAQKLHMATATNPLARFAREWGARLIGHLPALQRKLQLELSETDIVYRAGPLVELGYAPRHPRRGDPGSRALDGGYLDLLTGERRSLWARLSGGRHCLLLFADGAAEVQPPDLGEGFGKLVDVVRLSSAADPDSNLRRRYGIGRAAWVLIRPDYVIAARGEDDDLGALSNYFDRILAHRTRVFGGNPALDDAHLSYLI